MNTRLHFLNPQRWLTGLWRNPDFVKLWGSLTITHFGGQVTFLALPLTAALLLNATPFEVVRQVSHDYPHGTRVELTFVRCTLDSHVFTLSDEVNDARWQVPADIDVAQVLEADRDFLRELGAKG